MGGAISFNWKKNQMTCHKLLNVISLGIINWNRNYQKPLIDNVIYIYLFTTHPLVLGQDLHPNVTILISHTFLHLLRISALFSFSFHPLPYLLNPVLLILLVLSCPTTLSGSHVVTRACQLSTVPGITDQRTEGTRWAGQQRPSVHEGTWTVCSSLARAIEGVKNLPGG